ncbi:peptide ABC transporter substrate-binding protein [Vallitalea longa]|uniref:Peptide ABC transporter substrate-binding protein n=1 Tax=Vallitalea longa TaxID=2936439 RepID=A0A9W6DD87_9FIRM|nr:ABC transporter substrate-binding protein [Vallitalea longa]GKX27720.1 peptide ABC transporter substrate-binding protein [Vallitalea longa]
MFKKICTFMLVCIMTISMIGCSSTPKETTSDEENDVDTNISNSDTTELQKEAPMLAEKVKAGELPSLEYRLPITEDVMVESDIEELGIYGGNIVTTTHDHAHWTWGPYTEQSMFRFKQDGSGEVEPNVCKDFHANEDSTVWTIELREGMKWSDGEPFTADDVLFYYNHMSTPALNADRTPVNVGDENYYNAFTSKPYRCYYVIKDEKNYWAEFEKVDDYELTITFAAPKPNFPEAVAVDNKWMFAPKHVYKDFVARKDGVTDDETFPLITEEEALANANKTLEKQWDSYTTMGKGVGYYNWDYYQIPQLRSFIATKNNWDKVGETYELVRNPYFWKTDSEGRQLPYVDSIKIQIINELDQVTLKAVAGEFNFLLMKPEQYSTIASSTKDTHRVSKWSDVTWAQFGFCLNPTHKDLDKRKLYQDKRFRQALSIAVDRNLLNSTLANNQLEPWQLSPAKGMLGYDEEWSKKWTEYDVEKANKILDDITEPWVGKQGTYRKMKGTDKEVELLFYISEDKMKENAEFLSLLQSAYKKIGVKVSSKIEADISKMDLANDHDTSIRLPYGATPVLRPDSMVPMRNYEAWYGAYGKWYEDNKSEVNGGIEPTGDMLELVKAYENIITATGTDRNKVVSETAQKIYDLHKENIWGIGFLSPAPARFLIGNDLKNYPDGLVLADEFRFENLARFEQAYIVK